MTSSNVVALIALLFGALVIVLSLLFRQSTRGQTIIIRIGYVSVAFFSLFVIYFFIDQISSMLWSSPLPLTKDIATAFVIYFGLLFCAFSFYPKFVSALLERWDFRLAALGLGMVALGMGFLGHN
jgi:hypothetical protein